MVRVGLRQFLIEPGQPGPVGGPRPVVEDRVGAQRGEAAAAARRPRRSVRWPPLPVPGRPAGPRGRAGPSRRAAARCGRRRRASTCPRRGGTRYRRRPPPRRPSRREDAGPLRPGPGGEERGAEPIAPPGCVIEVGRGVVPPSQRRREQAKLQRDRAGGEHGRADHGELVRHRQQLLVPRQRTGSGLPRPRRARRRWSASRYDATGRSSGPSGIDATRAAAAAFSPASSSSQARRCRANSGGMSAWPRAAASLLSRVQSWRMYASPASWLAWTRPGVRLADPLAVGGGFVDELVGRLQRAGQGGDRGLARACQVQVARDRGPFGHPG